MRYRTGIFWTVAALRIKRDVKKQKGYVKVLTVYVVGGSPPALSYIVGQTERTRRQDRVGKAALSSAYRGGHIRGSA
jgi:hypothetical protein